VRSASRIGLIGGGALFLLLLVIPNPSGLSPEGWRAAAVAMLMAVWWMTEAIPIPATALLPLALFPTLGILDMPTAAAPYANEIIFLFMGGFIIAMAMERWGLHRRIALGIMAFIGTSPKRLILGFMVATGFLSMWISNTATATMMLPIAMAVAEVFRPKDLDPETQPYHFGIALMLGIAYAASIGGVATLIGTPPNAVMAAAAEELLHTQIGFVEWMAVGLPVAALTLPLAWLILVNFLHPPGKVSGDAATVIYHEQSAQGPMTRGEKSVAVVFVLAALSWVFRSPKDFGDVTIPGIETFAPGVRDSTIAMLAAVLLFLIPVNWRKGEFAMNWHAARKMPWGVLVLFGGGLSLARAMDQTGLAAWIGGGVGALGALPQVVLLALVATLFVFLTEVTSNTATATMAMPIMAGVAAGLGYPAITLMATAALSASMAFMLPVATPPNAIVFSSEYLTIPRMARAGFWMNIMAIVVITLTATLLIPVVLAN
jgi:sodium-dependent dicarboxylate transporter 2/3/5